MNSLPFISLDPMVAIGFIGALTVGVGFVLNQMHIWKANDFEYDFINLLGGLVLMFYAYKTNDWPIFVLFLVWALFSFKDCVFDYQHRFDWRKDRKVKKPKKAVRKKKK